MDHHGGGSVLEGTGLHQLYLATPTLFGRRAENGDSHPQVVGKAGHGQTSSNGGGGDDVVPACLAHFGKSVVLATDHDSGPIGPGGRFESGVQPISRICHLDPVFGHVLGEQTRCLVLLPRRLGVVGKGSGDLLQVSFDCLECGACGVLVAQSSLQTFFSAISMIVPAIASAPSRIALCPDEVIVAAANSG